MRFEIQTRNYKVEIQQEHYSSDYDFLLYKLELQGRVQKWTYLHRLHLGVPLEVTLPTSLEDWLRKYEVEFLEAEDLKRKALDLFANLLLFERQALSDKLQVALEYQRQMRSLSQARRDT